MGQATQNALDLSLVRTVALLQGQVEAQAELTGYVRDQLSRACGGVGRWVLLTLTTCSAILLYLPSGG